MPRRPHTARGTLDAEELAEALSHTGEGSRQKRRRCLTPHACMALATGVYLSKHELSAVMKVFDPDASGAMQYEALLDAVHAPLSDRRAFLLDKIWRHLCVTHRADEHTGVQPDPAQVTLTVEELLASYHPHLYPDVASGRTDTDSVAAHLTAGMNALGTPAVDRGAFMAYWEDMNTTMPADEFFMDMLERTWGVQEAAANAVSVIRSDSLPCTGALAAPSPASARRRRKKWCSTTWRSSGRSAGRSGGRGRTSRSACCAPSGTLTTTWQAAWHWGPSARYWRN